MKRVREIDLEAPVQEDDDGEDEVNGEETCTSAWEERPFTKKGRWIHARQSEIPQQDPKAGKWPRESASPRRIYTETYQNPDFLEFQAQHPGGKRFQGHEQGMSTAEVRTLPHVDLQISINSDIRDSIPQVAHELSRFETSHNVLESEQLAADKDRQVTEEPAQEEKQPARDDHSVPVKKRKTIFPYPPAVLVYSVDDRQDVELYSILEKQSALFSEADLHVCLEVICFIGQRVELIKESRTRKLVAEIVQQQLWKAEEPSVIQALLKVLCSVARISCADDPNEDKDLDWVSHVTRFLLQYITTKVVRGSPLKSGLKLQLLRSLSLIGQNGGCLELESVGPLAKEQLASSNPRLREYGVRLLVQSIKERNAVSSRNLKVTRAGYLQDVQRNRAEGDSLVHTLLEYTRDPYPNVREAVVWAILHLHSKGFALKHSTYKFAVTLLRDSFEAVRICAIKLVGIWVKEAARDDPEGPQSNYVDNAFLQICNMMTDMTMSVRQEACNVLAGMTGVSDSALLQSLTKKILTSSVTERGSTAGGSSTLIGDFDVPNLEENKLFDWSAAGAFVVGLEDEFWEVRSGAVRALAKLAITSEKMAQGALELIVDMINDYSSHVRQQTIQALTDLALAGGLYVLEAHLHMFIGILEDSKVDTRKAGHELLSVMSLPSVAMFQLTIRAILTSLDKHPEDEETLLVSLEKLGRSHNSHTESMASELVQELRGLLDEDSGLDKPRFVAILVLLLGAATANGKIISLIPSRIVSLASRVSNRLPKSLPALEVLPLGFKTLLYAWNKIDASPTRENHSEDQSKDSHRKWGQANGSQRLVENGIFGSGGQESTGKLTPRKDNLNHGRTSATVAESSGNEGSGWSSVTVVQYQESKLDLSEEQEILESTQRIVGSALSISLLLDMKAVKEVLQRISGCRKELRALKGRWLGLSGTVSFCGLYLECLLLVVQLRANFISQESRALVKMSGLPQDLLNKLESVLQHVLHRFSGFSFEQLLQILELHAIVSVWKLALHPIDHPVKDGPSSVPVLELGSTLAAADKIMKSQDLPPSPLLRSVQEQLLDGEGKTNILSTWRTARRLALSYWPRQISVESSVKEVRAVMKAPGIDFDHPLGFIPGLPLCIPIDVTVYNVQDVHSLWIQFVQDTLAPGYKLLVVEDCGMSSTSGDARQLSTHLRLDDMPPVASSVCRLCIVMEGNHDQRSPGTVGSGKGPRGRIVPICTEMKVHLYRIRERGSKQPPHGKR